jgi:hypothetical protein
VACCVGFISNYRSDPRLVVSATEGAKAIKGLSHFNLLSRLRHCGKALRQLLTYLFTFPSVSPFLTLSPSSFRPPFVLGIRNIIIKAKPMRYQILPFSLSLTLALSRPKRFMIIMKIICVCKRIIKVEPGPLWKREEGEEENLFVSKDFCFHLSGPVMAGTESEVIDSWCLRMTKLQS